MTQNIFKSDKIVDEIIAEVEEEIKLIDKWLKANKLSLNLHKTNYMIIDPIGKATNDKTSLHNI